MTQKQIGTGREGSPETGEINAALSATSKRQREGTEYTGPFGTRTGDSDLLFFEDILPKTDGELLSDRSIEEQLSAALDTLEQHLADQRNKTLADVMKIEIQLTDPGATDAVESVYESRFADVEFPPRTIVGVSWLPGGAAVQLDVVAGEE